MAVVENLDVFFSDFGVPVTWAGSPSGVQGILDFHDTVLLGRDGEAQVSGRVRGVTMKTVHADLLTAGQSITVGGTAYKVTDPSASKDGALSIVQLANPT